MRNSGHRFRHVLKQTLKAITREDDQSFGAHVIADEKNAISGPDDSQPTRS